jgi:hypothetical protein
MPSFKQTNPTSDTAKVLAETSPQTCHLSAPDLCQSVRPMRLRFRRSAGRCVCLAHLYSAVGKAILRSCYGQILRPRGYLPKFTYRLWRRLDAWVHLDPHLIWQATESYMERRDAFGLVPHECSFLFQYQQLERIPVMFEHSRHGERIFCILAG